MKSIGFVDYYLSEWHANSYPAWIKEAAEAISEDYKVAYAWAELDVSPVDGKTSEQWCAEYGATLCGSLEELCERSDVIMILAPSNPEVHLGYAREVLKYAKPTYIDKTFAPDYKTAKEIFDLAEKYGARFFSSSALRYSEALVGTEGAIRVTTYGGGSNFDEYAVHQAEMVIATLKSVPTAVKAEKQGAQIIVSVKLEGEKEATMVYSPDLAFSMSSEFASGERSFKNSGRSHFPNLIADILRFFESAEVSFDVNETLLVMKLREEAIKASLTPGVWHNIF